MQISQRQLSQLLNKKGQAFCIIAESLSLFLSVQLGTRPNCSNEQSGRVPNCPYIYYSATSSVSAAADSSGSGAFSYASNIAFSIFSLVSGLIG